MSNNFFLALQSFWEIATTFLTSVYLPGTNVTPLAALLLFAFVPFSVRFILFLLGAIDLKND